MPAAKDNGTVTLEEKLFTVRRKDLRESHIKLNPHLCGECSSRTCTYVCPAEVYVWDETEKKIDVRYENCLECGTCDVACEMHSIEWSNPVWGTGISYKRS